MKHQSNYLLRFIFAVTVILFLIINTSFSQSSVTGIKFPTKLSNPDFKSREQLTLKHTEKEYSNVSVSLSSGLGFGILIPPESNNIERTIGYGLFYEFRYSRSDYVSWYADFNYYHFTTKNISTNFQTNNNWIIPVVGVKIYPIRKEKFYFNIGAGPLFTDDTYKAIIDIGIGYEIRLTRKISITPNALTHLYIEGGPESFSPIPQCEGSFNLGILVDYLIK